MKISTIIFASIIAGALAQESPFRWFSKRSCDDCNEAQDFLVEQCPEDLYAVEKKAELLECLCDLPIEYFETLVICMSSCEDLDLSDQLISFDAEELNGYYCDAAQQIKTYTGDLADFTYSLEEENDTSVPEEESNTSVQKEESDTSVVDSDSTTTAGSTTSMTASSTNSAATFGVASILVLFALSML
ncbi:uncharacterized protein J8A68_000879 [[Candida] subhashii]|uniref:Uncharacterized protein n=1 Tax=[Candida] subhashii TaxID=561895 RepID=A0A8J5UKV9_9ASCO|nr:uncharacterized protein J8A68_000879 [[Candida] subhashii]KAG7665673.1 hypothetical protein J8A68_000879 [[Candida] subhashii]